MSINNSVVVSPSVGELANLYTAKEFSSLISVSGVGHDGREFHLDFTLDQTDPEFREMINNYAARKSYELISSDRIKVSINAPVDDLPVRAYFWNSNESHYTCKAKRIGNQWFYWDRQNGDWAPITKGMELPVEFSLNI